jgi:23S rRNA (uracil1939-C5)-methyltransferase
VAPVDLRTTGVAAGGDAVARDDDGRVVFVQGALPGERVAVEITTTKKRFARGHVVDVLDPSPDRVAPPCPHVARGCGGCAWQHVDPGAQRRLKVDIVADALRRIGGVDDPHVHEGRALPSEAFRTTVRLAVHDGATGFRRARSHDVVDVDSCAVAHPLLVDLLRTGDFRGATEVTLRCGARTGERLVRADAEVVVPPDVRTDHFHEEVAGARFRISAPSFFQTRADGADALVHEVTAALEGAPDGPAVDAYGGVGLFAATALAGRRTTLVEWSRSSVDDARVNAPDADVLRLDVARWRPSPAAVVVADPARTGLEGGAARRLAGTDAEVFVLVSCDPAALGRDAGLLRDEGYEHDRTTLVDLFPHTPHVECVTRFIRTGAPLRSTDR